MLKHSPCTAGTLSTSAVSRRYPMAGGDDEDDDGLELVAADHTEGVYGDSRSMVMLHDDDNDDDTVYDMATNVGVACVASKASVKVAHAEKAPHVAQNSTAYPLATQNDDDDVYDLATSNDTYDMRTTDADPTYDDMLGDRQ